MTEGPLAYAKQADLRSSRNKLKARKYDLAFMAVAEIFSTLSHDQRYKVGAVIVKNGQILSQGWNGMPSGMTNVMRDEDDNTKPEVIHAEANALMKLAKNGGSAYGAAVYTTYSPCFTCATHLMQAGITRVYYKEVYDQDALQFLRERGIKVERISPSQGVYPTEDE